MRKPHLLLTKAILCSLAQAEVIGIDDLEGTGTEFETKNVATGLTFSTLSTNSVPGVTDEPQAFSLTSMTSGNHLSLPGDSETVGSTSDATAMTALARLNATGPEPISVDRPYPGPSVSWRLNKATRTRSPVLMSDSSRTRGCSHPALTNPRGPARSYPTGRRHRPRLYGIARKKILLPISGNISNRTNSFRVFQIRSWPLSQFSLSSAMPVSPVSEIHASSRRPRLVIVSCCPGSAARL